MYDNLSLLRSVQKRENDIDKDANNNENNGNDDNQLCNLSNQQSGLHTADKDDILDKNDDKQDNINKKRKYNKKTITIKEFNNKLDYIYNELSKMIDKFYKQINEEYMPEGYNIPDRGYINELLKDIKSLRNDFKIYVNENKNTNKTTKSNYGLKIPQYLNINMTKFVNSHGDLPQDLKIYVNEKINYGVFSRISLTKFWVYYIEKNKLKDKNNKSIIMIDDNMRKLFNNIYKVDDDGNNITYLDFFRNRIDEINNANTNKKNNNYSKYITDDNNVITGFNFAALQVIIAYYFINGYIIPNNHKYIDRLDKINKYFSNKTKPLKLNNKNTNPKYNNNIDKNKFINKQNKNIIQPETNNTPKKSSKINILLSGRKKK